MTGKLASLSPLTLRTQLPCYQEAQATGRGHALLLPSTVPGGAQMTPSINFPGWPWVDPHPQPSTTPTNAKQSKDSCPRTDLMGKINVLVLSWVAWSAAEERQPNGQKSVLVLACRPFLMPGPGVSP